MTKYEIIRDILGIIAAILVFIIFADKAKKKSRTLALILGCLAAFVVTSDTLNYIPFENLFLSFDSAEEAFYYQHKEHIYIYDTFDYEDYTMVIADESDFGDPGIFQYALPKSNGNWKLDSVFYQKNDLIDEGYCFIEIIKIPKHNDYFLFIIGHVDKVDEIIYGNIISTTDNIHDNRNTEFQKLEYPGKPVMYYALIEDLDSNYVLYVDDTPISIE